MGVTKLVSSLWLKQAAFHHALKVTLLACFQLEVSKCRAIAISKSTSLKLLGDWGQEEDREPKKILEWEKGILVWKILLIWDQTNCQKCEMGGKSNSMCFKSASGQGQDQQAGEESVEKDAIFLGVNKRHW